jgi:hypothetical protein
LFELATATGAPFQMRLQRRALFTLQHPEGVECEILRELFV